MFKEQQVCSLELSKRLRDLGVKQESHFVWYTNGDSAHLLDCPNGMRPMEEKTYSAFTVAELGEMFPPVIMLPDGIRTQIATGKTNYNEKPFGCVLVGVDPRIRHQCFHADTEANARAGMLIYLLENKLITER